MKIGLSFFFFLLFFFSPFVSFVTHLLADSLNLTDLGQPIRKGQNAHVLVHILVS